MAVVRVRVNPDNINQIVLDTEDNTGTPFIEKTTDTRRSLTDTSAWQEFVLTIPDATRAFKIGDVVDTDLTAGTNYAIRLGTTWFRIATGVTVGADSVINAGGYTYTGNIQTLKP